MSPIEDTPFPRNGGGATALGPAMGPSLGLSALLGAELLVKGATGSQTTRVASITEDVVGLYFSASWCPPCRAFTPVLRRVYTTARAQNKSFQIVFCSQDRAQADFEQYWADMPWPAISFQNRRQVATLAQTFNLRGIPSLILVNNAGQVINAQSVVTQIRLSAESFIRSLPDINRAQGMTSAAVAAPAPPSKVLNAEEVAGLTLDSAITALDADMTEEVKRDGLATIVKLCENILADPRNTKFHAVKKSNKVVQRKLADRRFIKLLKIGKFVEYEDRYQFTPGPQAESALSELCSLAKCMLASYDDVAEAPADTARLEKEADRAPAARASEESVAAEEEEWVCEGEVCRRRTKN